MNNLKKIFFLIIKPNHFAFHVVSEDYKILLNEEIFHNVQNLENNLNDIKKFLDENIFKIEKKFRLYIKDIYLIFDDKNFVSIDISLINDLKNFSNNIDNNLSDLSNIKNSVLKSNIDFQLVHMIINKFIINKKEFSIIPDQIKMENFFLEIRFICLKTKIFLNIVKILSKYQISIKKVLSYKYVESFQTNESDQISLIASELINGFNKNEIVFEKKHSKNIGFFGKFFKFFS